MTPPAVSDGEVQDVFQHTFNDFMFVQGSVNKADGSIRDVVVVGQPADMEQSAQLMMSWAALMSAVDPSLAEAERGDILRDLGLLDGGWSSGYEADTVRNDIKYWFSADEFIGIWFGAGDPADS